MRITEWEKDILEDQVQLLVVLEGIIELYYIGVGNRFEDRPLGFGLLDPALVDYERGLLKLLLRIQLPGSLMADQEHGAETDIHQ